MIRITIDNGKGPAVLEVVDEALKAENEVLNRDLIARAETIKDLRRQIENLKSRADRYELQRAVAHENAQQAEKWRKAATARATEAVEAQGKVKDLEVLVAQMEADLNAKNRAAYEAIVNDPGSGEVEALKATIAVQQEVAPARDATLKRWKDYALAQGAKVGSLEIDARSLRSELSERKRELREARAALNDLRGELEIARPELSTKAQQVNALTVEVEALKTQAATLTEELNQSKDRGGEVLMEARDLKTRLIEQQRENDRLKDEIGAALKAAARDTESGWLVEAADLRSEINRQRTTVEALQSVIVAKDERIAEQKARIAALTSVPLTEAVAVD